MIKASIPPILIFGYGNPSRGDDALGSMMLEKIGDRPNVERLTDFQLQVEHSLDMVGRDLILFIDASESCPAPFQFLQLDCDKGTDSLGYTTHTLTPTELITAYRSVHHSAPPPTFLLTIRGERYELGDSLTEAAHNHLQQATQLIETLLDNPALQQWQNALSTTPKQVA